MSRNDAVAALLTPIDPELLLLDDMIAVDALPMELMTDVRR